MTDSRITQTHILALSAVPVDTRITQTPVLVLYEESPDERVTQTLGLVLTEFTPNDRVTQVAALALVDHMPCLSRWTQLWTITRVDGQVFRFTSLDTDFTYNGDVYKACDSMAASATEMSTAAGSTGSMELDGIISDSSITEEDLYNGLFDGSLVEIWYVPWLNLGGETPVRLLAGTVGNVDQGTVSFTAEITTPGAAMQQKPLLEVYTPGCRYKFGDERCTIDLDSLKVSGSVTQLTVANSPNSANKRVFIDNSRTEADNYFSLGSITWLTGANAGVTAEIKDFSSNTFVLWQPLLHPIRFNDLYEATPGCDRSEDVCKITYLNYKNYGGQPHVPGQDKLLQTPDQK